MKPSPTEYRGTVFRSKSEAVIARGFDLESIQWRYEPSEYEVDGWVPDFEIDSSKTEWWIVVEYKPTQITRTYRDLLKKRFKELRENWRLEYPGEPNDLATGLLIGSPFSDKTASFEVFSNHGSTMFDIPEFYRSWHEAKRYRFDLAGF